MPITDAEAVLWHALVEGSMVAGAVELPIASLCLHMSIPEAILAGIASMPIYAVFAGGLCGIGVLLLRWTLGTKPVGVWRARIGGSLFPLVHLSVGFAAKDGVISIGSAIVAFVLFPIALPTFVVWLDAPFSKLRRAPIAKDRSS